MEILRKEYEELGLTDVQIIFAASNSISPHQIKTLDIFFRDVFENARGVFLKFEPLAVAFRDYDKKARYLKKLRRRKPRRKRRRPLHRRKK